MAKKQPLEARKVSPVIEIKDEFFIDYTRVTYMQVLSNLAERLTRYLSNINSKSITLEQKTLDLQMIMIIGYSLHAYVDYECWVEEKIPDEQTETTIYMNKRIERAKNWIIKNGAEIIASTLRQFPDADVNKITTNIWNNERYIWLLSVVGMLYANSLIIFDGRGTEAGQTMSLEAYANIKSNAKILIGFAITELTYMGVDWNQLLNSDSSKQITKIFGRYLTCV